MFFFYEVVFVTIINRFENTCWSVDNLPQLLEKYTN